MPSSITGQLASTPSRDELAAGPEAPPVSWFAETSGNINKPSLECLASAMDKIAEGVVICDHQGQIVYRNSQAQIIGRSRDGNVLAENAIRTVLERALAGNTGAETLELYSPVRHTLVIRSYPLVIGDGTCGAVAVVDDVSERRRVDAMRRDFVANVSHELKTPVGALSLLAETIDGEEDPEVLSRLASRVGIEAGRLSRTIDDLLDLSRIEVNETSDWRLLAMRGIMDRAVDSLAPVHQERDGRLQVEPVPEDLLVVGSLRDLASAVANLVENALKYSEPSSPVTVRTRRSGPWIEVSVTDRGMGIPAREQRRIFERFYRVDRARSRSTGGTGLGLSIVRHVAVNHGGDVGVSSVEGEGSTFVLRVPAAEESHPDA